MVGNKIKPNPNSQPAPAPAAPQREAAPAFANPDVAREVLGTNQAKYIEHMVTARTAQTNARTKATQIQQNVETIARLQEDNKHLEEQRRHEEQTRQVQEDLGKGYAAVIAGFGVELPPLPPADQLVFTPPGDPQQRAAVWNGDGAPQTGVLSAVPSAPTDNPPAGFCNHCGKHVWRDAKGGLSHGIGTVCFPDDPNSPVASLGEELAS